MSNDISSGETTDKGTERSPRRRLPQIGLLTFLLLALAGSAWFAVFFGARQNEHLRIRIAALRPLAPVLAVEDETRIAILKLESAWQSQSRWDIYVPAGNPYRLCLATRGIDVEGFPTAAAQHTLASGRHRIVMEKHLVGDEWRVSVSEDGKTLIETNETKEWNSDMVVQGGGNYPTDGLQLSIEPPAVLMRARFGRPSGKSTRSPPSGPTDGMMLWIEKVAD